MHTHTHTHTYTQINTPQKKKESKHNAKNSHQVTREESKRKGQ